MRLYAVEPSDYGLFLDLVSLWRWSLDGHVVDVPWPVAVDEIVDTGIDHDGLTEVPIDLSGALDGEHGHLVMIVDGPAGLQRARPAIRRWPGCRTPISVST